MLYDVIVSEKGGPSQRLRFDRYELNIGRTQDNDICLPKGSISKRHARIVLKDHRFIAVDLKSSNGTYVNGRRISMPVIVGPADEICIGDFTLVLEGVDAAAQELEPETEPEPEPEPEPPPPSRWRSSPPLAIAIDLSRTSHLLERRQFSGFSLVRIGRSADNNIVLDDAAVAPHHASLHLHVDGLTLRDESGGRGLWVDGQPVVTAMELYPEAVIAIGPFTLRLRS